ncbi:MAG: hypothetical protein HQL32_15365, partial [Planctomycetes bacterium]|nr:hypothetical protein [Planctomycetota bacterium]
MNTKTHTSKTIMKASLSRFIVLYFIIILSAIPTMLATSPDTWPEAMLKLRHDVILSAKESKAASEELGLHKLHSGPWHEHELAVFKDKGPESWPSNSKPIHDYNNSLEESFKTDGFIDLKKKYLRSVVANKDKNHYARFRKTGRQDGDIWTSPHRYNNRINYYYKTVDLPEDMSFNLYLGFNEGCKVFLNGHEVFSEYRAKPHTFAPGQSMVSCNLKKGTNHLLLKLSAHRLAPRQHKTYVSFNPAPIVNLKDKSLQLFKDFPRQSDWFFQDVDRMTSEPIGADINKDIIPKNIINWVQEKRGTEFELQLIKGVIAELNSPKSYKQALQRLIKSQTERSNPAWLNLYLKACQERRDQRLQKLRQTFPQTLFAKRKMLRPSFYGYSEGLSCANFEMNFEPDTALCLLEWQDGEAKITEILKDKEGVIRDIEVSYDGKKVLFAWKKSRHEDDYHLYEMSWPDQKIRQLTSGLNVADFEGVYLPNGDIMFSSTRNIGTTPCWVTETSNMFTCDKDGKHIRQIGFDQVVTAQPSVLENGTVVFTRWDYSDRGQVFPQGLFSMNPDGTNQTEYYGNNSWFPTTINQARGIPGTDKL